MSHIIRSLSSLLLLGTLLGSVVAQDPDAEAKARIEKAVQATSLKFERSPSGKSLVLRFDHEGGRKQSVYVAIDPGLWGGYATHLHLPADSMLLPIPFFEQDSVVASRSRKSASASASPAARSGSLCRLARLPGSCDLPVCGAVGSAIGGIDWSEQQTASVWSISDKKPSAASTTWSRLARGIPIAPVGA